MNLKDNVSILAQTESGQLLTDDCVQTSEPDIMAINSELGLLVMAKNEQLLDDSSNAAKAVEILLDDMESNMPSIMRGVGNKVSDSASTLCLRESADNINEYLFGQNGSIGIAGKGVALAALQFELNQFSCIVGGSYSILLEQEGSLKNLTVGVQSAVYLGQSIDFEVTIVEQNITQGDLIIMMDSTDLEKISQDFLRITISRFKEEPEMLLRQINMRAQQNGLTRKPVFIMALIKPVSTPKKGWLNRVKNR